MDFQKLQQEGGERDQSLIMCVETPNEAHCLHAGLEEEGKRRGRKKAAASMVGLSPGAQVCKPSSEESGASLGYTVSSGPAGWVTLPSNWLLVKAVLLLPGFQS